MCNYFYYHPNMYLSLLGFPRYWMTDLLPYLIGFLESCDGNTCNWKGKEIIILFAKTAFTADVEVLQKYLYKP